VSANGPLLTLEHLQAALALPGFDGRAAQQMLAPRSRGPRPAGADDHPPREASALAFVFERRGALRLPLTLRTAELREHRGQVSLPGGRPHADETLWETAWREAEEEIGLSGEAAERLGVLTPVYIPVTHTRLHVHVAHGPDPGELVANPGEVERVELMRLDDLLVPERRGRKPLWIHDREIDVPYFDVAGLFVWGATAMALSELAERLRTV
jgi:8-oxo-dGTP pyrophosphatase MutT (NUDIX family)